MNEQTAFIAVVARKVFREQELFFASVELAGRRRPVYRVEEHENLQAVCCEVLDWAQRHGKSESLQWRYTFMSKSIKQTANERSYGIVPSSATFFPLSVPEQKLRDQCEQTIRKGFDGFIEVGQALITIRDKRLYREQFATFEDYMQARWDLSARHGYRLCGAAEVVQNLLSASSAVMPATESQARPLQALPAAKQPEVWEEAVRTAPNGKPTARHVQEVVERRKPKPETNRDLNLEVETVTKPANQDMLSRQLTEVMAYLGGLDETIPESDSDSLDRVRRCLVELRPVLKKKYAKQDNMLAQKYDELQQRAKAAGQFVICRTPIPNAIGVAKNPRYAGPTKGWSPDPNKVDAFSSKQEARRRCKNDDLVMPLAKAQRKFQYAL